VGDRRSFKRERTITAIHPSLTERLAQIDAAPYYDWGQSKEVIDKAIQARRGQVGIARKWGIWWRSSELNSNNSCSAEMIRSHESAPEFIVSQQPYAVAP
jgi:aryl-alcohol dehydrogenase-like predicted oxidoreductase